MFKQVVFYSKEKHKICELTDGHMHVPTNAPLNPTHIKKTNHVVFEHDIISRLFRTARIKLSPCSDRKQNNMVR